MQAAPLVLDRVRAWRRARGMTGPPLVVGVSGVQGAGKTTLTRAIAAGLHDDGLKLVNAGREAGRRAGRARRC